MSRSPSRAPVASDAFVQIVADRIADDLRTATLEPCLVHVTDHGADDLEVGVLPLDGCHPTELLLGFTAPHDWHALGVATRGWAYPTAERGSPHRSRTRVGLVVLLTRTGELAQRLDVDPEGLAADLDPPGTEPTGEQVDLLRRALGLPTPPPPCDTAVFWAVEWLSALLGTPPAELTAWDAVIDRHPVAELLRSAGASGPTITNRNFPRWADALAHGLSWTRLRCLVGEDRLTVPELAADDAAWLDDGAFARFVLSRCPPLAMLRHQVDGHLPTTLARELSATLDRIGVPWSSWPDTGATERPQAK